MKLYHKNTVTSVSEKRHKLLTIMQTEQSVTLPESEPDYSVNFSFAEFNLNSQTIGDINRVLSLVNEVGSKIVTENRHDKARSVVSHNRNYTAQSDSTRVLNSERSDGLVLCTISHREPKITVFAGMVKVNIPRSKTTNTMKFTAVRGAIKDFSRRSRKRMLESLAKTRNMDKGAFLTLTYPAQYPDNAADWKRHLDTFLKRLKRIAPKCFGAWRIEPQERGAPHFHLLTFNHPNRIALFRQWVKLAWYQVVGSNDEKHFRAGTRTDKIMNRKHAIAYAAKYAAKPSEGGRRFITLDGEVIEHIGKHWGMFNRAAADTSEFGEYTLTMNEVVELRRMFARWLKSKGARYAKRLARGSYELGFSVFGLGDDAQEIHPGQQRTILRMLLACQS